MLVLYAYARLICGVLFGESTLARVYLMYEIPRL